MIFSKRAKTRQSNKTIAYLETINPELAAMAKANPAAIPNIIQSLASNQLNPKTTKGTVLGSELKKAYPNNVNIEEGKLYNVEYDSEGKVVKATPVGKTQLDLVELILIKPVKLHGKNSYKNASNY